MKIVYFSLIFVTFGSLSFSQTASRMVVNEPKPSRQNYFGSSGDMDGNLAIITATHGKNPNAWKGGLAYVYKLQNGNWKFRNTLYPNISADKDRFGQNACDLQGKQIIIGDWMNAHYPGGAAHIFQLTGDTSWTQVTTLAPNNKEKYDNFGNRVAIYDNTAVVSTYNEVFIYKFENGKWTKKQILTGDQEEDGGFGQSLVLHKNQLIIGATWEDADSIANAGAVYVYENKNDHWELTQKLVASEEDQENQLEFGESLSVSDDLLAIGVPRKDMGRAFGAGAVYLYRKQKDTWEFSDLLYNERFSYGIYRFGERVSISGDFIAVSEGQDKEYNPSVYVYQFVDKQPKLISKIQEQEAVESNRFAKELMAISGNQLIAGDAGDGFCDDFFGSCGKAYFYSFQPYKHRKAKNSEAYASNWGFSEAEIKKIKRKYDGDKIIFDPINGDLVYKMRAKETGLWGMYQGDKLIIPAEYDSIQFYGWNDPYTVVGKDGKFGIYTSGFSDDGKLSVDCKYDDFKTYTFEGQFWLAGKRNGKWRWVNWYTGHETGSELDYHQDLHVFKNWNPGR